VYARRCFTLFATLEKATFMGLDEYRIQVIEQLENCRSFGRARELLAEVDLVLKGSGLSEGIQRVFWQAISSDLDVVLQESPLLLEKRAADTLGPIIAVAQQMIRQYQRGVSSSLDASEASS
jgi:hypothetical protein